MVWILIFGCEEEESFFIYDLMVGLGLLLLIIVSYMKNLYKWGMIKYFG